MVGLVLDDPNRLLPTAAGRILNVTPSEVRRLVDTGRLPAERILGVRLIERKAVENLARSRSQARMSRSPGKMR